MSSPDQTLQILIDVRSRLDEVVKAQAEFRKMREEVTSTGQALKTGFGIEIARRGLSLLTSTVQQFAVEAINMADSIKDGARNLTLSNQAYQVMGNLLHDAGGDVSMLTAAISNNNRSLVEARNVGSAASAAYRTLGLDVAQLAQLPIERRFELIARAVANATDKDKAFAAASQILVSRGLPTLLGALKDLAADGWDKVTEAQLRAGRVMTDDTIVRLEAAKKSIEKLKQSATIGVGEWLGDAMSLGSAVKRLFDSLPYAAAASIIKPGSTGKFFGQAWHEFIKEPGTGGGAAPAADGAGAAKEIALKEALAAAEFNLANATLHRQTVENDPNRSELQKRKQVVALMEDELTLRQKLIEATKASPLEGSETQQARDLRLRKLEEQNAQLRAQLNHTLYGNQFSDKDRASVDRFQEFNDANRGSINLGGATKLGAMDWVTGLGSAGEQVSGALQASLGATVTGISDGIYGWITGANSFGDAMLQLGDTIFRTIIQTIVQMGVQWLVTQALIKTGMITTHAIGEGLRVQRIAGAAVEGAATTAALAPAAATASISSFGAAAILGIIALVAAMALFGGFSSGGYTGDMPTNQIAGVVHGQEGVLNAPAMQRLGVENLDRLNAGQSLSVASSPAAFSSSPAPAAAGGQGGGATNVSVAVFMDETAAMGWLGTRTGKKILYRKLGQDRGQLGMET